MCLTAMTPCRLFTTCVCAFLSLGSLPSALLFHKSCLLMTTSSIGPEAGVKIYQLSEKIVELGDLGIRWKEMETGSTEWKPEVLTTKLQAEKLYSSVMEDGALGVGVKKMKGGRLSQKMLLIRWWKSYISLLKIQSLITEFVHFFPKINIFYNVNDKNM